MASPREIELDQFPIELGRGGSVGLRVDDRWLSRRHCELSELDGTIIVRDLGSRHGTYINGRPITESRLMPGDELCVGLSHFVVDYAAEGAVVHDSAELALA